MTRSFIRSGHGRGRGRPHVENPRDELPVGTPAQPAQPPAQDPPVARKPDGTPLDAAAARELGRRGGRRSAEMRALMATMGAYVPRSLRVGGHALLDVRQVYRPFAEEAELAYTAKRQELARDVGGGFCGVGASACVRTWAHAHHTSLMLFELVTGTLLFDPANKAAPKVQVDLLTAATRLAAEARQALLTAHSLAAEEAKARRSRDLHEARNHDPLAAYMLPEPTPAAPPNDDHDTDDEGTDP